ncbi:MAG: Rrf2 family transcriptional regulator iron-sulfur cluster assembly transcription factor [Gammaproteobacteria bacterium]|nr:MAG: Rrf2 family transcriptional regulator iron-sulfur cluster assembly transcription factor [Gammaproteobacteria bacterium]TND03224.1 MAG: Rrf2 family transcriptional regulator, iron-sulfur cluster assembly transcription factor [Gammaproteobacteria bacterium]
MKLTTKGRYAVTAMLDLAIHAHSRPVPLADISHRQGVSLSYLEQLFSRLRKGGLVESARGPGGGYRLARPAGQIAVVEVLKAIDENIEMTNCDRKANCQDGDPCLTHELWMDLSSRIYEFLQGISLGQLIERQHVRDVSARQERATAETKVTRIAGAGSIVR